MLKREEVAWVFLDVCIEVSGAFELGGKGGNDTRVAAEACCNSVDDNTEAVWRAHGRIWTKENFDSLRPLGVQCGRPTRVRNPYREVLCNV